MPAQADEALVRRLLGELIDPHTDAPLADATLAGSHDDDVLHARQRPQGALHLVHVNATGDGHHGRGNRRIGLQRIAYAFGELLDHAGRGIAQLDID
jgi:hypothetical protein